MECNRIEEVTIIKTDECTIYSVGYSHEFRIVQTRDKIFIIQKLYTYTETRGHLWWKKTSQRYRWLKVNTYGKSCLVTVSSRPRFGCKKLPSYDTLEKAKKWIEDFSKYPVYH